MDSTVTSGLATRLVGTLVTSFVLYLLGILSSKAPAFAALANQLVDTAGGIAVVSTGIAGFILVLLFALWRRVVSFWKLHVATRLPAGAVRPADVDRIYKTASVSDVLQMRLPTTLPKKFSK